MTAYFHGGPLHGKSEQRDDYPEVLKAPVIRPYMLVAGIYSDTMPENINIIHRYYRHHSDANGDWHYHHIHNREPYQIEGVL